MTLCVLTLTNLEGLSGKPPASPPVSTRTLHSLLAAATLLWFATGFLLAAPTVPWVWLRQSSTFAQTASMLTVYSCQSVRPASSLPSPFCSFFPIAVAVSLARNPANPLNRAQHTPSLPTLHAAQTLNPNSPELLLQLSPLSRSPTVAPRHCPSSPLTRKT